MPDSETFDRTVATIVLFGVWAAIVLGPMFLGARPAPWEIQLGTTAIVFLVIGRMWGLEVERVLGVVPLPDGGQPRDRDDDRED